MCSFAHVQVPGSDLTPCVCEQASKLINGTADIVKYLIYGAMS